MKNPFHGPWTYFSLFTFWNVIAKIHKHFVCLAEEYLPFLNKSCLNLTAWWACFLMQASGRPLLTATFVHLNVQESLLCYLPSDDKLWATATSSTDSRWGRPWHCSIKTRRFFQPVLQDEKRQKCRQGIFLLHLFSMMPQRQLPVCFLVLSEKF